MKKLLLSFLCVASSLAASALTSVVYYFDGTESAVYGMTRTSDTNVWNPEEITLTPPIAQETVILRGKEHTRLWTDGLRMYSGSSMEIIAPAGYVLTTIKIQTENEAQAKYFKLADGCSGTYTTGNITIGTGGTVEVKGGTWTGSSSSVTLNNQSGRADITSLTVNYEEDTYQPAGMSFPQESYEATLGQTFTKPELTKATDAVVTYRSSDESVATVDASTGDVVPVGAGFAVITATAPQTETYREGSASYTLTVIDPNAPVQTSWTLVTDINQINDNFEYIIASQGEYTSNKVKYTFAYTMVNTKVNNNTDALGTADVTITDNTIEEIAENTAIFSISKGNDDLYTFVTAVDGIDKYLTASAARKSSLSETPASLGVSISSEGTATISTIVGTTTITLSANPNNGKDQRFAFYKSTQKPVQLYYRQKPVSKPVTPDATVDGATVSNGETIELKGVAKTIKFDGLAEGVNIWYKFQATAAPLAEYAPEAGYTQYDATAGISLTQAGTLTYYAEKDGVVGDTHTINVTGTTVGISEIEAEGAATEWFDLSGRRVATPAKGVYLRKQGAKVTKIAF